jgi:hypothetical protein
MQLLSAAPFSSNSAGRILHSSRSTPACCIAAQQPAAQTHTAAATLHRNTVSIAANPNKQAKARFCVAGCQPAPWAAEPCLANVSPDAAFVADAAPADAQLLEPFPEAFQELSTLSGPTDDLSALLHPLAHKQHLRNHSTQHLTFPPTQPAVPEPGNAAAAAAAAGDTSHHNRPGLNGLTVGGTAGLATVSCTARAQGLMVCVAVTV